MTTNAKRDQNSVPTLLGVSSVDGTPVTIYADPTTHRLLVDNASAGLTVGTTTIASGTTGLLLYDNAGVLGELATSTYPSLTELSYVKGVTSAIQTQLGGKASTAAASTSAAGLAPQATAPASGLYNYVGITNGETAYTNKALFDATVPSTQAFGDAAAAGSAAVAARRDHKHAMMAAPTTVSGNAGTVTISAEASDTTCFPLFATAATGSLSPSTNANLTFNASTGVLTSASCVLTTADINGGTFDNATIGASTPSTIVGTTIQANTGFIPDANDGAYLGTTTAQFSDLFLAEGGVINWDNGDATLTQTGNVLKLAGAALETDGNIELGHASDTTISRVSAGVIAVESVVVPTISSTNTLTNKRITPRVVTTASDTTAVIDVDVTDQYQLTAMAGDTTFSTTGTPTAGQKLIIRFKDDSTVRAITWDAVFRAVGVTLPTTTVDDKTTYVGCIYNATDSKWDALAVGTLA